MKIQLYESLIKWPKPFISGVDLRVLLPFSSDSRQSILKRAVQAGILKSIRQDLYLIKAHPSSHKINVFEIAPLIYGPSYISFESALSYHGWIPEGVQTVTCATLKRARDFDTSLGVFSYETVPAASYPNQIKQMQHAGSCFFMATPLKALADFIYVRQRSWETLFDLEDDMRIGAEALKECNKNAFVELIEDYPNTRVKKTLTKLFKEIDR